MKGRCANIYKTARNCAELTQEQAAELLHISPRSLSDYEAGKTIPHGDVVSMMVDIYKVPWLGYEHLRCSTELGERYLPEISIDDVAKSVLILQKEAGDVEEIKPNMIRIACDGKIEEHENEKWGEVTREVLEMAGAALAVVFSK